MKAAKTAIFFIMVAVFLSVPVFAAPSDNAAVYTENDTDETEEVLVTHGKRELSAAVIDTEEDEAEDQKPVNLSWIITIAVCAAAGVILVLYLGRDIQRNRRKRDAAIRSARRRDELLSGEDDVIKMYTNDKDE